VEWGYSCELAGCIHIRVNWLGICRMDHSAQDPLIELTLTVCIVQGN